MNARGFLGVMSTKSSAVHADATPKKEARATFRRNTAHWTAALSCKKRRSRSGGRTIAGHFPTTIARA
jgi:hypothetical protein